LPLCHHLSCEIALGITRENSENALAEGLRNRSALLVATLRDGQFPAAVRQMIALSRGEIGLRIYPGGAHGEMLFTSFEERDSVIALIINWLDEQIPAITQ
jgi:dihydrodipicolinate synthase/N-acetylneuraminate lyase